MVHNLSCLKWNKYFNWISSAVVQKDEFWPYMANALFKRLSKRKHIRKDMKIFAYKLRVVYSKLVSKRTRARSS